MDYLGIIKTSYKTTINHPKLWFFGLALFHTLSLIFIYSQIISFHLPEKTKHNFLMIWHSSFDQIMAKNMFSILLTVIAIVISSTAYIFLVQTIANILDLKRLGKDGQKEFIEQGTPLAHQETKESKAITKEVSLKSFWPVVLVHLLAALISGLIFYSLFSFSEYGEAQNVWQMLIFAVTLILFLPAILLVVSQQLFTSLFIVLYEIKFITAIALAWRLLLKKWQQLLGVAIPVLLLYVVLMFLGFGMAGFIQRGLLELGQTLANFGLPSLFAIITLAQILGTLFLWVWLAVLHAFISTVFVLFFYHSVGTIAHGEEQSALSMPLPASLPGQGM